MQKKIEIYVAIDTGSVKEAKLLITKLKPNLCGIKIGKELFTLGGPQIVKWVQDLGFKVFLDLKFHDIPNTVQKACYVSAELGVSILNVHALGGIQMMKAAKDGVNSSKSKAKIIAVTMLTSHDQKSLYEIGINQTMEDQVLRLAMNAAKSDLDGIVCSALDIKNMKQSLPTEFLFVTPGIRLENVKADDQKRISTPKNATESGSNILVIGRPITTSNNPEKKLYEIIESIEN